MGRAPCCDKANVKKGPWSPEEDAKLKSYIDNHGTGGNWIALPQKIGLRRCGKSCRLRWLNYLRPNIKHGGFSEKEDNIICSLYISIGSRWSIIAAQLPGRTDNDIKNYWNTSLKKKLLGKHRKVKQAARREMGIKGSENSVVVNANQNNHYFIHQFPYWPEPLPVLAPIPYSNHQQPRLNDHASTKKLIFSYPISIFSSQQVYDQPEDALSSAPVVMDALNIPNIYQFASTSQFNMEAKTGLLDMLQGQYISTRPVDDQLEQMVYSNNTEGSIVDGLEFLNGDDMINYKSISMGEISSVAYPQVGLSNCEHQLQQEMLQECSFDELIWYHGPQ